jgi:hypothetical protein
MTLQFVQVLAVAGGGLDFDHAMFWQVLVRERVVVQTHIHVYTYETHIHTYVIHTYVRML